MTTRTIMIGLAAALFAAPALAAPPTPAPAAITAPAAAKPTTAAMPIKAVGYTALYKRTQEKLKTLGKYAGPIDGSRNPEFVKSVEAFQKDHNLKATGRVTRTTQKALGI